MIEERAKRSCIDASEFLATGRPLHMLINNAGINVDTANLSFVAFCRSLSFHFPLLAPLLVNRGKQFGESPLVEMAGRAVAVWLDPFGMLLA